MPFFRSPLHHSFNSLMFWKLSFDLTLSFDDELSALNAMLRVRESLQANSVSETDLNVPVKPVAGTNLGEVGFSSTPVTSRVTGWSAAENDSKGQQVVLASGFSCASTARSGAAWLAAETDLEDQLASAGECKKTIGLQEVVATTAGGGWLVAEADFEDQHASAGESKETIGLQEVAATTAGGGWLAAESDLEDQHASAGESKGTIVLHESYVATAAGGRGVLETVGSETADQAGVLHGTSSLFLNSRIHPHGHRSRIHGLSRFSHARARVAAAALPAGAASGSAVSVVATPARFSRSFAAVVADAASACATSVHDSAFNSGSAGGLLPVCKSTSYNLEVCSQGPTGRKRVKGGVSRPAEDLRPVSEVEAGVKFRPAGQVRGHVAGSLPGKQPGAGSRPNKGSVVTPSLHPEVPDSLSVSPGPGKRIRQSMGWTKVCGTAQSGIWVLKGNASTCMFPANLDYLRVGWRKQGSYKTAWVTPGHDCLCSYKYGHGAAVRPQTNKAIWDGVIGLWGRVPAPLVTLVW